MPSTEHIFVYGLLMFPEIVEALTGTKYQTLDALLNDHQRRGLSQSPLSAPVPVLTEAPGRVQQGKLLLNVSREAIAILDFFEELDSGHYVKKAVRVQADGQWYSAFCYAIGPTLTPYIAGDWQPELVSDAQKAHFIQQVIPQMLQALHATKP
jgi:hypothetical protein